MLAVTGSSGSGKTTLLSLVGGLARPTAGEASYDGGPVTTKQGEPLPGTGFVLQSYGLVTTLTAVGERRHRPARSRRRRRGGHREGRPRRWPGSASTSSPTG